jgi:GNAT superfamily N-acetyltransferase
MLAFTEYVRQKGYDGPMHPRKERNVLACLNLNPAGCFVAEEDDPVGYIFSRTWGTTGWIGTFGVHPDIQGRGIGRSLLSAAVEHLRASGCTTVGLETMSDSPYNVGFYSRSGFLLAYPTVLLEKELGQVSGAPAFGVYSQLEEEALSAITEISQAACPGLDCAPEAANAREYEWGETLLLGLPNPWAFAIVQTVARGEGPATPTADAGVLVLKSKAEEDLAEALQAVEAYGHGRGLERLSLAVNAADGEALRLVLDRSFRVKSAVLRMIFEGKQSPPVGRVLCKWLM